MAGDAIWSYREDIHPTDGDSVREIVLSSGFFSPEEVSIAVELVEERLEKGEKSGYFFLFASRHDRVGGYACFGPIAGSLHSYDLYWIAVHDTLRRQGLGRDLLARSESIIRQRGGRHIYIETSSRPQYKPTLAFYLANGYGKVAFLEDFYAPGDGKIILVKIFGQGA